MTSHRQQLEAPHPAPACRGMDIHATRKLAMQLMAEHGLNTWTFGFNRRKRSLGLCYYQRKRIELSVHFVIANDAVEVRDTILHEIAHALAGQAAGHGPRWKAICQRIGARPQRLDVQAVMPRGRWQATCPGCGRRFTRHRRPQQNRHYACVHCGPRHGTVHFQHQ